MMTSERKAHILNVLKSEGRVLAKDVSRNLGLSEDTIRRDGNLPVFSGADQ